MKNSTLAALGLTALMFNACSGLDGEDGERGARGPQGMSDNVEVSTAEATKRECPSGGTVLTIDDTEVIVCNGANGDAGPAQEAFGVARAITCSGYLDTAFEYYLGYRVVEFTDGSAFAFGSVATVTDQVSASDFFPPGGDEFAEVYMTLDTTGEANGGWWSMGLNREKLLLYVNYNDGDVPRGTIGWGLNSEKNGCVEEL
ncbi:MAG TPA: hypothetical protein VHO25_15530 [Polyangiaceae bacterium]|nr:hypothetical protein [Polyangiaceae bacterium]